MFTNIAELDGKHLWTPASLLQTFGAGEKRFSLNGLDDHDMEDIWRLTRKRNDGVKQVHLVDVQNISPLHLGQIDGEAVAENVWKDELFSSTEFDCCAFALFDVDISGY